jgi:hypothetical protein
MCRWVDALFAAAVYDSSVTYGRGSTSFLCFTDERWRGMPRIVLLLSSIAAALVLACGVALADHLNTIDCETANCEGTNEADHIIGTDGQLFYEGRDYPYARGGDDFVETFGGDDYVNGGHGNDTIYGGTFVDDLNGKVGNDSIYGGEGPDEILGNEGNDFLHGGTEKDGLYGESGKDEIRGGAGADTINTGVYAYQGEILYKDGEVDVVDCGSATDTVAFEKGVDKINANCEKKFPY